MTEEIKKAVERLTGVNYPTRSEIQLNHSAPLSISFDDDGRTPNNSRLGLIIYRQIMVFDENFDPAAQFEVLFQSNGWKDSWRDSMYPYIHFHTQTHEVLGLARGRLLALFGGSKGDQIELLAGDVVVIPAGVGHKRLNASHDLLIVGAYPGGGEYDELRPGEIAHKKALDRITKVPVPARDPVYGAKGLLHDVWRE